jgi:hypothetical protein
MQKSPLALLILMCVVCVINRDGQDTHSIRYKSKNVSLKDRRYTFLATKIVVTVTRYKILVFSKIQDTVSNNTFFKIQDTWG